MPKYSYETSLKNVILWNFIDLLLRLPISYLLFQGLFSGGGFQLHLARCKFLQITQWIYRICDRGKCHISVRIARGSHWKISSRYQNSLLDQDQERIPVLNLNLLCYWRGEVFYYDFCTTLRIGFSVVWTSFIQGTWM